MTYKIRYGGTPLESEEGYYWEAVDKSSEYDKNIAEVLNAIIEMEDTHTPIAVILDRMGDIIEVENIPEDTSDDYFTAGPNEDLSII